jgi:hypothetical protein
VAAEPRALGDDTILAETGLLGTSLVVLANVSAFLENKIYIQFIRMFLNGH